MKLLLKYSKYCFVALICWCFSSGIQAQNCVDLTQLSGKEAQFNDDQTYPGGSVLFSLNGLRLIKSFAFSGDPTIGQTKFTKITNAGVEFTGYLTLNVAASTLQCKTLFIQGDGERLIIDQDTIVMDGTEVYPISFGKGYRVEKRNDSLAVVGDFKNVTINGGFGKLFASCLKECPPFVDCKVDFNFQIIKRVVTFNNASNLGLKDADFFAWEIGNSNISFEESPVHDFPPGLHNVCLKIDKESCLVPHMKFCKEIFIPEEIKCELDFSYEVTDQGVNFKNTSTVTLTTAETDNLFWSFGDGDTSSDNDPSKYYSTGIYEACLEATNEKCDVQEEEIICKRIVVKGNQIGDFTMIPNEDGVKDDLFVQAGSKIYDRSGYLVLEVFDDINWNGVGASNQALPMGVYTVVSPEGKKFNVTIIR